MSYENVISNIFIVKQGFSFKNEILRRWPVLFHLFAIDKIVDVVLA